MIGVINNSNQAMQKHLGEKGLFTAKLQEKDKLVFEVILSSLKFLGMFSGKDVNDYITYSQKTRKVHIPCLLASTKATTIGNVATEEQKYYKDVTMKQRHPNSLTFHIDEMIEVDNCM
jgi:Cu/Zn superoxide dismutase